MKEKKAQMRAPHTTKTFKSFRGAHVQRQRPATNALNPDGFR